MDQSFTISGQQITETYSGVITIHSRGKFTIEMSIKDARPRRLCFHSSLLLLSWGQTVVLLPCFQCSKITHCHPGSFLEGIIMKFSNSISYMYICTISRILWVFSYMLSTMVSINETHFKTTEMNLAHNSNENFSTWIHFCTAVLASYFYGDILILIQKFF